MADLYGFDQDPFDTTYIYEYADIAIALSELKIELPLDRFKACVDETLIHSLSDRNLFNTFTQYLADHLARETKMLDDIDVITLVHYMIFSSTENKFAIDFEKIDGVSLCELFKNEFEIDISFFRDLDLDNQLMNNLASYMFIDHYRTCYKSIYPERFIKTCYEEERRVYLKIFNSESKLYNFVDEISEQLIEYYDEIQSINGEMVVNGFEKSTQIFFMLEEVLNSMNFYKTYTRENIRLELEGIASLTMQFMVEMCAIIEHIGNIPCLTEIHNCIIERLANCLEQLFEINKRCILPSQIDSFKTPVESPNGFVIQYDNGVIECLLEAIDILTSHALFGSKHEILILQNLLYRIITAQIKDCEYSNMFKEHFLNTNLVETMTEMCGKALNEFKSTENMTSCNVMIELLVGMYESGLYVANNTISKLLSTFTLQMEGNEEIREKCCFIIEKLKTKRPLNTYFTDMNLYKSGFDRKIDMILCDQFCK